MSRSAFAACPPKNGKCDLTTQTQCNFTIPSSTVLLEFCCDKNDPSACAAQKASFIKVAQQNNNSNSNDCVKWTGAPIPSTKYSCEITQDGKKSIFVCGSEQSCQNYKNSPSNGYTPVDICEYAGNSNECTACKSNNGIWTAMGCIPFEQDGFVIALVKIIMGFAGFISFAMMIVGTFIMMTGGANPEQMKKGKEIFTGGVIGLLFLIFSVIIFQVITEDIIKLDIGITGGDRTYPDGGV